MKTQSNIPIPKIQLWKEGQYAISVNPTLTDEVHEADFTIVDALSAEEAIYAFTRMTQEPVRDNRIIHNMANADEDITVKPVYNNPVNANIFPALPNTGWMEQNHIYSYQDGAVMVVQSHERTNYAPELTPALFSFYRPNTPDLLWIPNEQVQIGWKRWYNDKQYECIQAHMTLSTWTPDVTPALWNELVVVGEQPPQWVSANYYLYVVGYQVYNNGKIWQAKNTTHTWIEPSLTGNGAISWQFVKDWI